MNNTELLELAISQEAELLDYNSEELNKIGSFLGNSHYFFKEMCKAYLRKDVIYENKPMIGAKVTVTFNWEEKQVSIQELEILLQFELSLFLRFIAIVESCFSEVYPLGTVVELDLDFMPESFQVLTPQQVNDLPMVLITGRKLSLKDTKTGYVIDYLAQFWPFGETPGVAPLFLSSLMIRRSISKGFVTPQEEATIQELKESLVRQKKVSFAFMNLEKKQALLQETQQKEGSHD